MTYQIEWLTAGQPKSLTVGGKETLTAYQKKPIPEKRYCSALGLEGDSQVYKDHGGVDKALLVYPYDHYSYWENKYQLSLEPALLGENITLHGLTEEQVHIGDELSFGDVIVQVTQPRQPCYKIAQVRGIKEMPAEVVATGYSGYYCRVLKEGYLSSKDKAERIKVCENNPTVREISRLLYHEKNNKAAMEEALKIDTLADSAKKDLQKQLDKMQKVN